MRTHSFELAVIVVLFGMSAVALEAGSDDKLTSAKPIVYRGKTFEEWVGAPRQEICEEYLVETLAAIGEFGKYGYEDRVFDAVWSLVENYHSQYWQAGVDRGLSSKDIASQALRAIVGLPLSCIMPKLKEFAESDRQNQRRFAFAVLFIKSEYSFPEEHWEWVYEQALTREWDDLYGASWSQLLGRCDSSGKLLIRYLTELVRRQDKERFVAAFSPVVVTPQAASMGRWYDWGVSSNLNLPIVHQWYPRLILVSKGGSQTNVEHISALRKFFIEVGAESENEVIRLHSTSLLAALNKQFSLDGKMIKDDYPTIRAVAPGTTPSVGPYSPLQNATLPSTVPPTFIPIPEN
ncbi:MAG: hypothetical protein ACRC46_02310 [Thermoguttaceae bacterium]